MNISIAIGLFPEYIPVFYPDSLGNRQSQERLYLIHLVAGRAPNEPKQVHPILQPRPVVARMGAHEFLHFVVDVVYGVHRVLPVLEAFRLR